MPDASVAMSVKDNLSQAVVGMRTSMPAFRTDVSQLLRELDRPHTAPGPRKQEVASATPVRANPATHFAAL